LQKAHRLLKPGQRVVDLGCWPGGWIEFAAGIVGWRGRVVGVDLAELDPPLENENAIAFVGDLEDPSIAEALLGHLGGPADVVLCDAAPKLTGVRDADRAREERLLEAIEALVPKLLRPGGDLVLKLLEGPEAQVIGKRLRKRFAQGRSLVPEATRKGSSERYLLGRGFKG
jgi:23S rRNA (uridine2552-2'-O)-methyltransferase